MPYAVDLATASFPVERRGGLDYRNLKITHAVCGGLTASCSISSFSSEATEVSLADRVLRVYDSELDVIRFHGRLRDPLERSPGAISLNAASPLASAQRFLLVRLKRSNQGPAQTFKDLIDQEHARSSLHTRVLTPLPATPAIDLIRFNRGTELAQALRELTALEIDDGIFYLERPVDEDLIWTEIEVLYPDSGVVSSARFDYDAGSATGQGGGGNCVDYKVVEGLPINGVHATGGASGDDPAQPKHRWVSDPDSVDDHGLLETFVAMPDVNDKGKLAKKARKHLQPEGALTFSFTPMPAGNATAGGVYVPRLWRDFDPGDYVRFSVDDGATQYHDVVGRVLEATISVADQDETEQLDAITLEVV